MSLNHPIGGDGPGWYCGQPRQRHRTEWDNKDRPRPPWLPTGPREQRRSRAVHAGSCSPARRCAVSPGKAAGAGHAGSCRLALSTRLCHHLWALCGRAEAVRARSSGSAERSGRQLLSVHPSRTSQTPRGLPRLPRMLLGLFPPPCQRPSLRRAAPLAVHAGSGGPRGRLADCVSREALRRGALGVGRRTARRGCREL